MNASIQTGTTHSYEECPQCKSLGSMILETYVTGEQAGFCGSCGYQFARKVLRGVNGDPILDSKNQFIYSSEEVKDAYGAVHIVAKTPTINESGEEEFPVEMYSIPTEEDFNNSILPYIAENKDLIQEATLCQLVENQIIKRDLLNPPTT